MEGRRRILGDAPHQFHMAAQRGLPRRDRKFSADAPQAWELPVHIAAAASSRILADRATTPVRRIT